MSKSYRPGDDADEIIARQVAKGKFTSADAVVQAGVRMLEEIEADVAGLVAAGTQRAVIPSAVRDFFAASGLRRQDDQAFQPRATMYWPSSRRPLTFSS